MNGIKKIICLLMLTAFISRKAEAQPALHNQAITITNFTVYEKDTKLFVDWSTDGTIATNYWQVQISDDGKSFSTIAIVLGPDPKQPGDRYQYMEKIKAGRDATKYYRLCHVDVNGNAQMSGIITPAK
jgi:hypothetical protein